MSSARIPHFAARYCLVLAAALVCALAARPLLAQPVPGRQTPRLGAGQLAPPPPPTVPATPPAEPPGEPPAEPPGETSAEPAEAAQPEAAQPTVEGPEDDEACRRIVRVAFEGLRRLSPEDIQESVQTREGQCFTRSRASADAHRLWDLGFFRDIVVHADPGEGGLVVRFALQERPSIRNIRFEGNDEVDDDKLRETIDLREGAVLSEPAVRRNVQKIRDLYAEKGFFLAEVSYTVVAEAGEDNRVDIVFRIVEHAQVQVRSIQFIGNLSIPTEDLRGVMTTNTTGFFSFLTSAGTFREEAFRNDVDLLHAAYYDRGYLTVEIESPRVMLSPDRRFIDIVVNVREGPRFRIGRLRVLEVDDDGNEIEPLGGRRALRERVHVSPSDWFSRTTIGRDILGIQTHYRDGGYANVEVTPDIQPHQDTRLVDLSVRIRRGPMVRVQRIEIRGNSKTADRVIRREMELVEGARYSETGYQNSRRRIMALGYFERVDLSTEPVEGHPDQLVVNVEVTERPTGTFQIGAGFSSVENFIATAQIQQLNLFGRGQSLTLQAQFSSLRQIFALRFVEPYFLDSNWTFALDLYNSLRAFQDFTRSSTGGTVTFGYPILGLNDLRLFVTYTGEEVGVNTRGGTGFFGQTTLPSAFRRLPLANLFQSGFTSSLGVSLVYDTRDNRLYPRNGVYARVGFNIADPVVGSENVYTRATAFFRTYRPLFGQVVLRLNVQAGLVTSRAEQGVPIFERFFLGGIFDVRGYRLRTLGPRLPLNRDLDPNSPVITNGAIIGGNVEFYYNLEVEFPILTQVGIRGVVFTDAGNTFNTERTFCTAAGAGLPDEINPCNNFINNPLALRYSVGFGLRWQSPLGLLRFEWGFPLNRLAFEESSVFEFTIGNFF